MLQAGTDHASVSEWSGRREKAFAAAYGYLRRHRKWLRYWEYRAVGLPIGSGVTAAACKTVFSQRLKQSGMRWEVSSGQVVVTLRVVLLSGVWEAAVSKWLGSQQVPTLGVKQGAPPGTTKKVA